MTATRLRSLAPTLLPLASFILFLAMWAALASAPNRLVSQASVDYAPYDAAGPQKRPLRDTAVESVLHGRTLLRPYQKFGPIYQDGQRERD